MKKLLFPFFVILLFSACVTPMPISVNPDDSYLMHVECVPGATTRNEVLLLLKRAKARDVKVDDGGGGMTIEAAYYKADNDIGLLESIADDIRLVGTVVEVDIRDNPNTVRQNR
jgi:hypothetical protein